MFLDLFLVHVYRCLFVFLLLVSADVLIWVDEVVFI